MNRQERRRQAKEAKRQARQAKRAESGGNAALDPAHAEAFKAALSLQHAGRFAEAERAWRDLLDVFPNHDGINTNFASLLWQQGKLDEAAEACRRAIGSNPDLAEAHAILGAVHQALDRADEAIDAFEKAHALKPGIITVMVSLANLYKDRGDHAKARELCEQAEAREPGRVDVLNTLGVIRQAEGEYRAAETYFKRAATAASGRNQAQIQTNLAGLCEIQGRHEEAVGYGNAAIDADPNYVQAHNTLGAALKSLKRIDEAEAAFKRALEIDPDMAAAESNLGLVHSLRRDWDAALVHIERSIELDPQSAEAYNNRGIVLHCTARREEAAADFDKALAIDPDFPDPHLNRGLLLLLNGEWRAGWPEFEWRWRTPQMAPFLRDFPQPQWDGTGRPTDTLLLHAEQGMGDTLQFIRYAPLTARRVGRIVVETQPSLIPLLEEIEGIDQVVARGEDLPEFHIHLPMLSLPGIFETEIGNTPADVPYLRTPEVVSAPIPEAEGALKVGLVWAGNPDNPNDPSRSTTIEHLRPLLDVEGCAFYSLQHGVPGDEIEAAGLAGRIHDLRPQLTDFGATAAIVDQLDMVVSICTSVAHLAGGMGAETWIMLSKDADWRWLLDREDCPWYPTARLFRQRDLDDWDELAERLASALTARVRSGAAE